MRLAVLVLAAGFHAELDACLAGRGSEEAARDAFAVSGPLGAPALAGWLGYIRAAPRTAKDLQRTFQEVDRDADGSVSFDELMREMRTWYGYDDAKARASAAGDDTAPSSMAQVDASPQFIKVLKRRQARKKQQKQEAIKRVTQARHMMMNPTKRSLDLPPIRGNMGNWKKWVDNKKNQGPKASDKEAASNAELLGVRLAHLEKRATGSDGQIKSKAVKPLKTLTTMISSTDPQVRYEAHLVLEAVHKYLQAKEDLENEETQFGKRRRKKKPKKGFKEILAVSPKNRKLIIDLEKVVEPETPGTPTGSPL